MVAHTMDRADTLPVLADVLVTKSTWELGEFSQYRKSPRLPKASGFLLSFGWYLAVLLQNPLNILDRAEGFNANAIDESVHFAV